MNESSYCYRMTYARVPVTLLSIEYLHFGTHYFTERNGLKRLTLFHGTERTVQCTAELYSAMSSQNTKSVMRSDDLRGHQTPP